MNRRADGLDLIPIQKLRANLKASHEAPARSAFGVPVARDLRGVFSVENGIENRLMRQSRREFAITAASDQIQSFLADRAKEDCCLVRPHFDSISFIHLRKRLQDRAPTG